MNRSSASGPGVTHIRIVFLALISMWVQQLAYAQTARQLAADTFPSVVLLVMQDANGQPVSLGSGFFVADGIIATNLHVVQGASSGQVKIVGQTRTYPINGVVGLNVNADIVLMDVKEAKAPPLELAGNSDVAVGDVVYAVGNPEGLEGTFSQGIVSGIRGTGPDRLLQITAPISPGSSGGPIINNRGQVIGIAVATFKEGQNLNFAVPASTVTPLLRDMGKPRPLASEAQLRSDSKTSSIFNSDTTQGVTGIDFRLVNYFEISFAVLNRTSTPVKDVHFLVVFFGGDKKHGFHPIDYIEATTCPDEVFLPNLPKRQNQFLSKSYCSSVYPHAGTQVDVSKVEVRILDFRLAQ